MKPFNLEKALAGEPVITKNGLKVTQLHLFKGVDKVEEFPLLGVVNGEIESWNADGSYTSKEDSDYDLYMSPKKVEYWVNVYAKSGGEPCVGALTYSSEQEAKNSSGRKCLGQVKIWEEMI